MTRLSWGAVGERFFEAGVDRGVLYLEGKEGVPWNGLISVTEEPSGGEATPYYFEGVKYYNKIASEEFEATIEAYTYPEEFSVCDGTRPVKNGLFTSQQPRKSFALSYRNQIGNDTHGLDHGYKIHLIFGAYVAPSSQAHSTLSDSTDPFNFSWKITTKPIAFRGYRPSAHFVIDSRDTPLAVLAQIEDILYGSAANASRIPSVPELMYIFESYNSSLFDAGTVLEPYYGTFDAMAPSTVNATTIDGGAP